VLNAQRLGIGVYFTVTGPPPRWAQSTAPTRYSRDQAAWMPHPTDFYNFVKALGTRYSGRYRKSAAAFAPDAMEALLRHPWPGNVRELDHTIERSVLLAEGDQIRGRDLGLAAGGGGGDGAATLERLSLEEVERVLIQKALARAGGNVSEAAKALGLSRSALYRRLQRHGL